MPDATTRTKALQELNLKIVAARKRGDHDEVQRLKSELEPLLSRADGPLPSPALARSRRAALRRQGKLPQDGADAPDESVASGSPNDAGDIASFDSAIGRFEAVVGRFEAVMTRFEAIATRMEASLPQAAAAPVQGESTEPGPSAPSSPSVSSAPALPSAPEPSKAAAEPTPPVDPLSVMRKMSAVNEEIVAARRAGNDALVRRLEQRIEELQQMGIQAAGGMWDPRSG